jgi:nucleoside-diphosphate-sugar epimerase
MKILVTGATGYIGWELCKRLSFQGNEVNAMCRSMANLPTLPGINWVKGNVEDKKSVISAMEGCRQVYHAAAFARMTAHDTSQFFRINVDGTQHVLEAATYHDVERVLYTSTAGVIGRSLLTPMTEDDVRLEPFNNDYDLSKHMAEVCVRAYANNGKHAVIVNPSRVVGPGKITYANAVTRTISNYLQYPFYMVPGTGEAICNYVYIDDVINGHLVAMKHGRNGERYILGGTNSSYNNLFALLNHITGLQRSRIALPQKALVGFAYLHMAFKYLQRADAILTPELGKRLCQHRMLSHEKASRELGYTPTDLDTSLRKTLAFLGFPKSNTPHPESSSINPAVK